MGLRMHGAFNLDDELLRSAFKNNCAVHAKLKAIRPQGECKSACSKSLRPGRTAALAADRDPTHLMHGMLLSGSPLTSCSGEGKPGISSRFC
jgi:hypothetical protein